MGRLHLSNRHLALWLHPYSPQWEHLLWGNSTGLHRYVAPDTDGPPGLGREMTALITGLQGDQLSWALAGVASADSTSGTVMTSGLWAAGPTVLGISGFGLLGCRKENGDAWGSTSAAMEGLPPCSARPGPFSNTWSKEWYQERRRLWPQTQKMSSCMCTIKSLDFSTQASRHKGPLCDMSASPWWTDSVTWSPGVWLFCDCEDLQRAFTGKPAPGHGKLRNGLWFALSREDQGPFSSPALLWLSAEQREAQGS